MKKKNKIYIKDWMGLKPYSKQSETDLYYLNLCNEVKKALSGTISFSAWEDYLDDEGISSLCCFLVSYLEDLVSETNIWNAFVSKHIELYGEKLPFYDTRVYFEKEINQQDVHFLMWYFLNLINIDSYLGIKNFFMEEASEAVMEVFEREYEYAPENLALKSYYQLPDSADYYQLRNFMQTLFLKTYLFIPDKVFRYTEMITEITSNSKREYSEEQNKIYFKEASDKFMLSSRTSLLGLRANEWVAAILGSQHPLHHHIQKLSPRVRGWFFYRGQDEENIYIEHIATEKKFKMTQKSFDDSNKLEEDTLIYLGMVKWKGEWWFSGISVINKLDNDLILNEKKSISSRKDLNFLEDKEKIAEVLAEQENAFLEYNNGSPITFLENGKVNKFVNAFHDYYNKSLNLSKKERRAAEKKSKEDGVLDKDTKIDMEFGGDVQNVAVYFNPKSGIEFYVNLSSAFPTPENPFYSEKNKEECSQDFIELLMDQSCSTEIVKFCADHFRDHYEFFQIGIDYSNNEFDFLLRFYKNDIYYTKPEITLTGKNENQSQYV